MTRLQRSDPDRAVSAGILSAEQADRLAEFIGASPAAAVEPRFFFVHVLVYLGGMIAIGAMSLFMTLGWNALGGWGGFFTVVCYGVLALALTHRFIEQKQLAIPAGIMATLAVVMVNNKRELRPNCTAMRNISPSRPLYLLTEGRVAGAG